MVKANTQQGHPTAIAGAGHQGKADLAGGRSRKKLTKRDQISIGGLVEPFAPHHQFIRK